MEYKIIATDGRAKRAEMTTVHGKIQTPVFMNVGTVAAIKGAVSTDDLREIRTQVELSNTYHLHVRTGDKLIKEFGGPEVPCAAYIPFSSNQTEICSSPNKNPFPVFPYSYIRKASISLSVFPA